MIQDGFVQAGNNVSIEPYTEPTVSIVEMYREYYNRNKNEETFRRHFNAPIAIRARKDLEKELEARRAALRKS